MPGFRIFFKAVHHLPAVDSGKADVEDDGVGFVIIGIVKPRFAVGCDEAFEAFFVGQVV